MDYNLLSDSILIEIDDIESGEMEDGEGNR